MLDPTRLSLDAATVGFRTRMGQSVDWGSFNQALQTQSESIKVRRELEETPVSEIHVMGGQLFGMGGNQKTNELARQERQMNGYPLRSFLVTGGPIVLPSKRQEGLLAIPINRGLPQYTQYNGVIGSYASSFTEPLTAPMESGIQLLARAGVQARSDSIVNPYKALQFSLNMHKTQEEIKDVQDRHLQLRGYNQEGLLKASMNAQNQGLVAQARAMNPGATANHALRGFIGPRQTGIAANNPANNPLRQAVAALLDPEVYQPEPSAPPIAMMGPTNRTMNLRAAVVEEMNQINRVIQGVEQANNEVAQVGENPNGEVAQEEVIPPAEENPNNDYTEDERANLFKLYRLFNGNGFYNEEIKSAYDNLNRAYRPTARYLDEILRNRRRENEVATQALLQQPDAIAVNLGNDPQEIMRDQTLQRDYPGDTIKYKANTNFDTIFALSTKRRAENLVAASQLGQNGLELDNGDPESRPTASGVMPSSDTSSLGQISIYEMPDAPNTPYQPKNRRLSMLSDSKNSNRQAAAATQAFMQARGERMAQREIFGDAFKAQAMSPSKQLLQQQRGNLKPFGGKKGGMKSIRPSTSGEAIQRGNQLVTSMSSLSDF